MVWKEQAWKTKKTHGSAALPCEYSLKLCALFLEMLGVFLIEFLNTSGSINQLLLAGKKGVTGRTDLNFDCLVHRTKFYFIAAGTLGHNLMICGMDIRFHRTLSLQKTNSPYGD